MNCSGLANVPEHQCGRILAQSGVTLVVMLLMYATTPVCMLVKLPNPPIKADASMAHSTPIDTSEVWQVYTTADRSPPIGGSSSVTFLPKTSLQAPRKQSVTMEGTTIAKVQYLIHVLERDFTDLNNLCMPNLMGYLHHPTRVARFLLVHATRTEKNVPNEHKMYQMVIKYPKCP
jgi:hypothetical protein